MKAMHIFFGWLAWGTRILQTHDAAACPSTRYLGGRRASVDITGYAVQT